MKINWRHILIAVIATLAVVLLFSNHLTGPKRIILTKTDTIFVDKPYKEIVIKKVEIEKPIKVYVYRTDTIYRQKLEKDTLITSVEITPKTVKIHTITPKGIPMVAEYPKECHTTLLINHKGQLKTKNEKRSKRKKLLRKLTVVGVFVLGVLVGGV